VLLALATLGLLVGPLDAQTTDPKIPASSPVWWTLTDEITPQELRRIYGDPKDSQRRYLLAVEKGLVKPLSPERLEELVFFQHGGQSPELLPMSEAFTLFAFRLHHRPSWIEAGEKDLLAFGISAGGIETIIEGAERFAVEAEAMSDELREDQGAFLDIMRRAQERLGGQALDRALEARDVATLSIAAGTPVPETRRLMEAWEIDPAAEVSATTLPRLKDALTPEDWEAFRRYLLIEVAPVSSATDFRSTRA
jgi:hypothetical protein